MDEPTRRPSPLLWGVAGFMIAVFGGGLLIGGVSYALVKRRHSNVRRGWNLVPVTVAKRDLPARTRLGLDDVSQRSIPEQFVTSSVVKPDSVSFVIGATLLAPLKAGAPLMWGSFATPEPDCGARLDDAAKAVDPALSRAAWEVVGAWKKTHPQRTKEDAP